MFFESLLLYQPLLFLVFIYKNVVFSGFRFNGVNALPFFNKIAVFVKSVRIASLSGHTDTVFDSAAAVVAEFVIVQVFLNFFYVVFIEEIFGLNIFHKIVVVKSAVLMGFLQIFNNGHLNAESSDACADSDRKSVV